MNSIIKNGQVWYLKEMKIYVEIISVMKERVIVSELSNPKKELSNSNQIYTLPKYEIVGRIIQENI